MELKNITYYIVFIIFTLGLLFFIKNANGEKFEGFTDKSNKCPNLLIKKDGAFFLHNTNNPIVPGVNPIQFKSLNEYVQFIEWQRSQGVRCPILYFQQTSDTQGCSSYRMLPDPQQPNLGLNISQYQGDENKRLLTDASRSGKIFNKGLYPGYDPTNQDIGIETPIDKIFTTPQNKLSDNPMDVNWGGAQYSMDVVKSGKYSQNQILIKTA